MKTYYLAFIIVALSLFASCTSESNDVIENIENIGTYKIIVSQSGDIEFFNKTISFVGGNEDKGLWLNNEYKGNNILIENDEITSTDIICTTNDKGKFISVAYAFSTLEENKTMTVIASLYLNDKLINKKQLTASGVINNFELTSILK